MFFCERWGGKGGEGEGEGFPADSQPIPGNDQIETRTVEVRTAIFAEGQMLCMQNLQGHNSKEGGWGGVL